MQEEKELLFNSQSRRTRINRIKKIIKWAMTIGIILPCILTIILFVKVSTLNKSVNELEYKWNTLIVNNQEELSGKLDGVALSVDFEEMEVHENLSDTKSLINEQIDFTKNHREVEEIIPSSTNKVYLTFDDGPSINTNEILDILAEYDVKATFFVVGKEEDEYSELYKRIVDEGHTIGIHSYSHVYSEIYASAEAFLDDFWKLSDYIYELTGTRPFCYRFPGGSSTTKMQGNFEIFKECIESCGVEYYDWNVSSHDATVIMPTEQEIINNVINDLGNYGTSIVLFHDAYGKQSTVDALPEIIEHIQKMENTVLLPISNGTELIHQK